jgi:hypothetical protein
LSQEEEYKARASASSLVGCVEDVDVYTEVFAAEDPAPPRGSTTSLQLGKARPVKNILTAVI